MQGKVILLITLLTLTTISASSTTSGCQCADKTNCVVIKAFVSESSSFILSIKTASSPKVIIQQEPLPTYKLEHVSSIFKDSSLLEFINKTSATKVVGGVSSKIECYNFQVLREGKSTIPFSYKVSADKAKEQKSIVWLTVSNNVAGKILLTRTQNPKKVGCKCEDPTNCVVIVAKNSENTFFNLSMKVASSPKIIIQQETCLSCKYELEYLSKSFRAGYLLKFLDKRTFFPKVVDYGSVEKTTGGYAYQCYSFQVIKEGKLTIPFSFKESTKKEQKSAVELTITNKVDGEFLLTPNKYQEKLSCKCDNPANCVVLVAKNNKSTSFNLVLKDAKSAKVVIQFETCPSCGYEHEYLSSSFKDSSVLKFIDKKIAPLKLVDAAGVSFEGGYRTECYNFQALKEGKSFIPFSYFRRWEKKKEYKSTFELTVANYVEKKKDCVCTDANCQVLMAKNDASSSYSLSIPIEKSPKIIVQIETCPSCGYIMKFVPSYFKQSTLLKYIDMKRLSKYNIGQKVVGGYKIECYNFEIIKEGKSVIPFFYWQPWIREEGKYNVVELTVNNYVGDKMLVTNISHFKGAEFLKNVSRLVFIVVIMMIFG